MNPPGRPGGNWLDRPLPADLSAQVSQARDLIERHLGPTLLAAYLHGSALDGGLKPCSDLDLLVVVAAPPDEATRRALLRELLDVSAPPAHSPSLRALEVTVVVHSDVVPWRYPARRQLQFGEWLRQDIGAGIFEPAVLDPDLAILLTQVRQTSLALLGPPAEHLFDPVPCSDFHRALSDTLGLWNTPADWSGEERNVVLALARIWYSAVTGEIAPKAVAADWAAERLPARHRSIVLEARQAYLGWGEDRLSGRGDQVAEFIDFVKAEIAGVLANGVEE